MRSVPSGRSLLFDQGAWESKGRLCLPPELVEACLAKCPSTVTLHGRGGHAILGDGSLHVHNVGGARDVFDAPGARPRPATAADVAECTRLMDALEFVSTITPLYTPRDVPGEMMILTMFDQALRSTLWQMDIRTSFSRLARYWCSFNCCRHGVVMYNFLM